jgi:hypothetical protein
MIFLTWQKEIAFGPEDAWSVEGNIMITCVKPDEYCWFMSFRLL